VFHVGCHLRSFSAFAQLDVGGAKKVLLVPKGLSREYFLDKVVNEDLRQAGLGVIADHVAEIFTAPPELYRKILRTGVIFNQYLQPAGSNLISECISAEGCLILNRHSAFEEYLGRDYPLFYDSIQEAGELVTQLNDTDFRAACRAHLRQLKDRYSVDQFCRELERIAARTYLTQY
jgi:hypothetical protein